MNISDKGSDKNCDEDSEEEEGYFGQEQVPLTDEIREILEEYPDGQIFKVREQDLLRHGSFVFTYLCVHYC